MGSSCGCACASWPLERPRRRAGRRSGGRRSPRGHAPRGHTARGHTADTDGVVDDQAEAPEEGCSRQAHHRQGDGPCLVERNGGRLRKTAIVALARKLLVALWKYVSSGVVIEGAAMTPKAA